MTWRMAHRADRLDPSTIREVLKLTERPGIISLAGGLPAADTFPVEIVAEATSAVLRASGRQALQYATSEGFPPLREWVADRVSRKGIAAGPDDVLITTGSQQALDLIAKVLVEPGAPVAVESPTYLGALQAFSPYEPSFAEVACDEGGPVPGALQDVGDARLLYLLPTYQNPTGRCLSAQRRQQVAADLGEAGVPLVEDDPYGDLWYDVEPAPPVSALMPGRSVYVGSFSKILAPGLRLGYLVAPPDLYPKLLQAKQAADLHTSGFTQRIVHEVVKDGFLDAHVPTIRADYTRHRDAMAEALTRHLPPGCRWSVPAGGMFFWVELPPGADAAALLPAAVAAGVAFVPGSPFFAGGGHENTLRLSFVTVPPDVIDAGVALLGGVIDGALQPTR
ncbi:PLP-dependent aminotransferase family protein [Propionicicella superfundia]|uniref:aminotransferase-like domain-containing protein n=1 Tax=Propionicicella superfundia TaxID=348582 RepID=UPI0003F4CF5A|nr:PLP-dependent aminotransferase family protein [Propionicicella superfundia]